MSRSIAQSSWRRLTAGLLVGALVFLGLAVSGSQAKVSRSFFGIVPQEHLSGTDFKRMGHTHVGTLHTGLYWPGVEPTRHGGKDFSSFDRTVKKAAKNGIKLMPFLYGTPDWVAHQLDHRHCVSCVKYAPRSKSALKAWKRFARAAARRYGPRGTFWSHHRGVPKRPIRVWQIWNEQNSKGFYLPRPSPKRYARLISRAHRGVHSQDRKAEIVLGGMFGTPGGNKSNHAIAAATFLRKLLKIKGAKHDFDGYALHPYSGSLKFVAKQVRIARRALRKSHYRRAELWITEIGWASGGRKSALNLGSKKAQARRLKHTYKLFEHRRHRWHVRLVSWYSWEDSHIADAYCFFCAKSGLIKQNGKAKPSMRAYRRVARKR